MTLQRVRIIVGDAGIESVTSTLEVWCAIPSTNEPQHIRENIASIYVYSTYLKKAVSPVLPMGTLLTAVTP